MTPKDFENHVASCCQPYVDLNYSVIALNGEAGEVAEWYKKFVLRNNPGGKLTKEDLMGELGDVLFYLTSLALVSGWTLDDIMTFNVDKLKHRALITGKSKE